MLPVFRNLFIGMQALWLHYFGTRLTAGKSSLSSLLALIDLSDYSWPILNLVSRGFKRSLTTSWHRGDNVSPLRGIMAWSHADHSRNYAPAGFAFCAFASNQIDPIRLLWQMRSWILLQFTFHPELKVTHTKTRGLRLFALLDLVFFPEYDIHHGSEGDEYAWCFIVSSGPLLSAICNNDLGLVGDL